MIIKIMNFLNLSKKKRRLKMIETRWTLKSKIFSHRFNNCNNNCKNFNRYVQNHNLMLEKRLKI